MTDANKTESTVSLTRAMGVSPLTRRRVLVDVTEWNPDGVKTTAWVREMLTGEREEYERLVTKMDAGAKTAGRVTDSARALLICLVLCDADGNLIFHPEDAPAIMEKPVKVTHRIYRKSLELDGFLELVEDEQKNF